MSSISGGGGPAEGGNVLFRDQRIAEFVILVIIFNDRAGQLCAFLDIEALADRAGRDIAYPRLRPE